MNIGQSAHTLTKARCGLEVHSRILQTCGHNLRPASAILDFGCGEGRTVYEYRKLGHACFGVDVANHFSPVLAQLQSEGLARAHETVFGHLRMEQFRIPFPDQTFDFIFSDQVFEHVQNYPESLAEIYRVLKPGGVTLHIFPSRFRPIECHVYVPFASVLRSYPYLLFWAVLGIRNEFQKGLPAREVARLNHDFLESKTNYLPARKLEALFQAHFQKVNFAENAYLANATGRTRMIAPLSRRLPFVSKMYSCFRMRFILCVK